MVSDTDLCVSNSNLPIKLGLLMSADISNPNLIGKLLLETHKSVSETITGQSRDLCSSDASTVATVLASEEQRSLD